VDSLTTQLADLVGPVRLGTRDAVGFLRSLTNLTPVKANVWGEVPSAFLDQYLGGSSLECWPHELRQDRYAIRLLSLTDPPLSTFAHILQGLLPVQSEYIVCSEWSRIRNEKARSVIKRKMSNFNFLKTKITSEAMASNQQQVVVNQDAKKIVKQMNDAVAEMELNSSHFGRFALTIAVFDEDEHRLRYSLAKMYEVFSRHDATVVEESLNALNAWAAMMPGNYAYSLRNLMLLNTNYADMAVCLFSPSKGEEYNAHLKDTALALLETREATLYNLNLHYQDVGHTLLVGSIGSGKSFLLNFLVLSFQKYQPYTTIFDLGGSYKALTAHRGGSYLHLGNAASTITINPFTLPLDAANLDFLVAFVQLLIEAGSYSMTPDHLKDLAKQIKRLYRLEPEVRRLSTLALMCKREYSRRLDQFVNEGRFASYFDNELDTLTVAPFQTFDFEGIDNNSPILEPLLFYVLHRASARIHDPLEARRPKLFALDEAWRFFGHATTRAYIHEALKTWRKRNATVVLATQSYDDLVRSELRDTILESCMTTMFLANPGMDAAAYKEAFAMNSAEAKLVAELIPKRQFLVRQPSGSKILNLDVDDESYRVYANKPREAKEAHA
jgi:type IV secretion/conjugal transfer VirB4 family ATPase